MYVHDIEVGTTASEGKPEIIKETPATALVEGNNLLGPVSVICWHRGSGHFLGVMGPGLVNGISQHTSQKLSNTVA